ncbi:NADH-quinone oxidoreductase subunit H [Streptomyces sp. 8K308]|uniref:complex I subunit 1 family protein n=1 Tax=Streptomyces sp. 8K308 TaxID=2530388 RepID=UPI00104454EA|nr:NADH-quinone oxidoreductase subunit H [Streptomyces sp. 8K308]TDC22546.1 NADH-quinone oxidoreductase subunit H [Streptomyces sp. 8K308]
MTEAAPLWWSFALPPALALAAGVTAALAGVGAGRRPAPLRELARRRRRTVAADAGLRTVGAVLLPVAAVAAAVVLPLGFRAVSDLAVGVVWFNAMGALAWAAVWLVGWGSNSALALIGGYRFLAQGLAYEVPHMLALTTAALGAGSLRVGAVVEAQRGLWFAVWMPAAFAVFLLSAAAMAFWGPFDQPVGRDVAGGAAGELGGVDRLVFLGGRWLLLVVAAWMAAALFLGGGQGPLLSAWCWTLVKTAAVLGALLWLRRRLPAVRMDRFTALSWTVLMPLAVVQALWVAVVVLER